MKYVSAYLLEVTFHINLFETVTSKCSKIVFDNGRAVFSTKLILTTAELFFSA